MTLSASARGWVLALLAGATVYVVCLTIAFDYGWPLWLAVPVMMGFVLGYHTEAKVWLLLLGAPALLCGFLLLVGLAGGHGMACLAVLGLVMLVPVWVGAFFGWVARPKAPQSLREKYSRVFLLALAPPLLQLAADLFPREPELVTVATEHDLDAPPEDVWKALHFYEEVEREPPLLLRIGMPVPVGTEGTGARVGDEETCVYERGYLKKRVTEREEARRLAFTVTEQQLHFERDLRLRGGSFDLAPRPGGGTRLTLTTRYEPLCHPGWLWRPIEAWVLRTLHGHVAGAVADRCAGRHALAAR